MTISNKLILCIVVFCLVPIFASADYGYLTMPVDPATLSYSAGNAGINSWFDHTSPQGRNDNSSTMTRYDGMQFFGTDAATSTCANGVGCYNGHEGIDYAVTSGTQVFAAASGTVEQAEWQDPNMTSTGFGRFVRIWHPQYGVSTLYGHLNATTTGALSGSNVARHKLIGFSGNSGDVCCTGGYHLHFQVYSGNTTINSSTYDFVDSVDPYGWSGTGSDPWTNDNPFGYMWASRAATSSVYNVASGTMSASTTWNENQIYIIKNTLTIASGTTLTIPDGVVVKFATSISNLLVDGILNVNGTAANPVYFTSIKDDSVGGDTNDDATTTSPASGDWEYVKINSGATSTISNAVFRYGGNATNAPFSDLDLNSGSLVATNDTFSSSTTYGLQMGGGTTSVTSSTFLNNGAYGFYMNGTSTFSLTSSTFIGNKNGAGYLDHLTGSLTFTPSGNNATGTGKGGFVAAGTLLSSETWYPDLPYVPSNTTVSAGNTLTIEPGAVVKFSEGTDMVLNSNSTMSAVNTSTNAIYFTSINDTGADGRNTDATTTAPVAGDWQCLDLNAGSTSTITGAIVSYGGHSGCTLQSGINAIGGSLNISNTTIASSSAYGVYISSSTVSIASSTIRNSGTYGIYADGSGNLTLTTSTFSNNGLDEGDIVFTSGFTFTPSGDTATGTSRRAFLLSGSLSANQTIVYPDLPYDLGSFTIASGKTLTVDPGVVMKFNSTSAGLIVNGNLDIEGTSTNEVYLTSLKDDSAGGDTNADGTSTTPAKGDWYNIQSNAGASTTIRNAVIRYGGHSVSGVSGDIYMDGGNLNGSYITIGSSSNYGLQYLLGTVNTVVSSTFSGNTTDGAYNNTTTTISLINNYWNASSGPFNASSNPSGAGDHVTNNITFSPFLTQAP